MTLLRLLPLSLLISLLCFSQCLAQGTPAVGSTSRVDSGVIQSMRRGTSDGKGGLLGTAAGAVGGAALAGNIGSGSGRKAAQVAGGVLGAKVGNNMSARRRTEQVVEFMIQLDNGQRIAVVQSEANATGFREGDKVDIITDAKGNTRIQRG